MPEHAEDLFAHTRMSFGDHIEDLRKHLVRGLLGFVVGISVSFFFGHALLALIARPVEEELMKLYDKRVKEAEKKLGTDPALDQANAPRTLNVKFNRKELAGALGIPPPAGQSELVDVAMQIEPVKLAIAQSKAQHLVDRPPTLAAFTVTEGFMVYMKVCVYCAIVITSPWLFYQIWSFVAAGLYPHEKRYVNRYLPISIGLFLSGALLCEFVFIPKAVEYLLNFNEWLGLRPELRLSDWLSFAILMPLMFGIGFQTPLVMLFLERLGIMTVEAYQRKRRIAMFVLALAAAVLSASPDPFSLIAMTVALWGLYELGIFMCRLSPRPASDIDVPEPEEMVEV